MVSNHEQVGAYANTASSDRNDEDTRETEKRALLSCASRLSTALDEGGKDMVAYAEAIRHNQRLWTIFQVAVCEPENPLPRDLKLTLLNLSRYVDKVSFRAITEFSPQLLNSMIDINRIIATGLTKKPGATKAAVPSYAPPAAPVIPAGSVNTSA